MIQLIAADLRKLNSKPESQRTSIDHSTETLCEKMDRHRERERDVGEKRRIIW
jgi:hypothetical protein